MDPRKGPSTKKGLPASNEETQDVFCEGTPVILSQVRIKGQDETYLETGDSLQHVGVSHDTRIPFNSIKSLQRNMDSI